jgi:hypothetical protein
VEVSLAWRDPSPRSEAVPEEGTRAAHRHSVSHRHPYIRHAWRGSQTDVPTGGTIGTGIGRTDGVGIDATRGGASGGISSVLSQIDTCRHRSEVQSNFPTGRLRERRHHDGQRDDQPRSFRDHWAYVPINLSVTCAEIHPVGRGSTPVRNRERAVKAEGARWGWRRMASADPLPSSPESQAQPEPRAEAEGAVGKTALKARSSAIINPLRPHRG